MYLFSIEMDIYMRILKIKEKINHYVRKFCWRGLDHFDYTKIQNAHVHLHALIYFLMIHGARIKVHKVVFSFRNLCYG